MLMPEARTALAARVITRSEAAAYCGLSLNGFRNWVENGRLPGPIAGTHRWDRHAIDRALDRLSGLEAPVPGKTEFDAWLEGYRANRP